MLELLKREAERLARNVYLLTDIPNEQGIVGYWGGVREDLPNTVPKSASALKSRRHLFSFDATLLSDLGTASRGPIALFQYELAEGSLQYRIEEQGALLAKEIKCSGIPLYASLSRCLPPFDAICLFGSDEVEQWLRSRGLTRYDYWKLGREHAVEEYDRQFVDSYYLYANRDEIFAVLHPWPILWPEDDVYSIPPLDCLALTLHDAEPWLEIWHCFRSLGYQVKERIS